MPTSSVIFECLRCKSRPIPARCVHCGDNSDCLDIVTSPLSVQLKNVIQELQAQLQQSISRITPEAQQAELLTENQQLTTALALKETELADLQSQIRALSHQLTETENSQPLQKKLNKLAKKLESVKRKLVEWTEWLTDRTTTYSQGE